MNTPMKPKKYRSNWVGFGALGLSFAALSVLLSTGACSQIAGSRCNPALSHDECDNSPTVQCVTPAGQGNSYCCAVQSGYASSAGDPGVLIGPDGNPGGLITDTNPNCQSIPAGGYTCPLGSPCWTPTGCVAGNANTIGAALCAGITPEDAGEPDAEPDAETDAAMTSDAGDAGTASDVVSSDVVTEATTTTEEASVEASTLPEAAAPEASTSTDGATD